jgi:hypothetical protein
MTDTRNPLGLKEGTETLPRLGHNRRGLLAFYLCTAVLAVMALLLATFR